MTSLLSYPFENISRNSILDKSTAKKTKVSLSSVEYINPIQKEDAFVVVLSKAVDNFEYPSLNELRRQFEKTMLYNKTRIDEMIKAYERLPKYRAQSNRTSRSKRRG